VVGPNSTLTVAAPETVTEYWAIKGLLLMATLEFSSLTGWSDEVPLPPQALRVSTRADANANGANFNLCHVKSEALEDIVNSYSLFRSAA
jgi:hypothetical protein